MTTTYTAAGAYSAWQSGNTGPFTIADTAADVVANVGNLESLQFLGKLSSITLTDSGTPTLALSASQWSQDRAVLTDIQGSFSVAIAGLDAYSAASLASYSYVSSVSVVDTENGVRNEIDTLQTLAAKGILGSMTLTDGATTPLAISATQLAADARALAELTGNYSLSVTGVTATNAASVAAQNHVSSVAVSDSSANLAASLDSLEALAAEGKITSITQTDYGVLSLTAAQIAADAGALAKFTFYGLNEIGVSAAAAATVAYQTNVDSIGISDTAANISANIATIETLAHSLKVASITVTDGGTIQVTDSYYNINNNWRAFLTGGYTLSVTGVYYGAIASRLADPHVGTIGVLDTASEISYELDSLELMAKDGKLVSIGFTDSGTPAVSLTVGQVASDADALALLTGSYTLSVTGATAANAASAASASHVSSVSVSDTLADIGANLAALQSLSAQNKLGKVTVTDFGSTLTLNQAQWSAGQSVIPGMAGNYHLVLQGVSVSAALTAATSGHLQSVTIADTAANVAASFDQLQGLTVGGTLTSIALTDSTTPTLTLNAEQLANDARALADITSPYTLATSAGPLTIATLMAESGGSHGLSSLAVADTAAHVSDQLDLLQADVKAGIVTSIALTDGGTPALTINQSQLTTDAQALAAISGPYDLALVVTAANAPNAVSLPKVTSISVNDTAQNISSNIDVLETLVSTGKLTAIIIDNAQPISLTQAQQLSDAGALNLISGGFNFWLQGVSATGAASAASPNDVAWISVSDSAANIMANLASLETLAIGGKLRSITLTDTGTPLLPFTTAQMTADAQAIALIHSPYKVSATGLSVADFNTQIASGKVTAASIADTAAVVFGNLDALSADVATGTLTSIALTDGGVPALAITEAQLTRDAPALGIIVGSYGLDVSQVAAADAVKISAVHNVAEVGVSDSAANVAANLDGLQSLSSTGKLSSLAITDGGSLSVTAAQMVSDGQVINGIAGKYTLTVTDAPLSALSASLVSHASAISVSDSGANISVALDTLQSYAAAGKLRSVTVTDTGFASIPVTAAQLASDSTALKALSGNFIVKIDASGANLTASGVAGSANIAAFTNPVSDYSISVASSGNTVIVTDTGTGRTSTDHLTGITELQFGSQTDIVAQTPGDSAHLNTGNITELYGAVFGRLPDAPGLNYYENELQSNSSLPLTFFAQQFLASPEYANNAAHNYAQTAAGDAQFITDSYQNLLGRAPEAGAVPYYQSIINHFTAGLTPGTAAYTAALATGHAYVLTDFSASAEFLGDVSITAQTPSSSQHWLLLTS